MLKFGLPYTIAGYVWKGIVISATVHGYMILCPSWYQKNIGIIFSEEIIQNRLIFSIITSNKL